MQMARNYIASYTLNSILNLIRNGSLAVPAFQRGFVWRKENIKQLFESINDGFPIGVITVIEHEPKHFEAAPNKLTLFPESPPEGILSTKRLWILDGSQRLASLYNVFLGKGDELSLSYDLEKKEFFFPGESKEGISFLTMSSLFEAGEYMKLQTRISKLSNNEVLLEELHALHNRFTTYPIPIQVLESVSDEDIITIFTRINSRGIALRKEDIQKALKYKNTER
jgi:uncharacterized protein with ParB-like and HNH nuclease domain